MSGLERVQPQRETAEDVGVQPLLSVCLLEGLLPVSGCQVQDAVAGPARQETKKVSQVSEGLQFMKLAAREQTHKASVNMSSAVGPEEHPVFASDGFFPQLPLRAVIMERQSTIINKALQCNLLVTRLH